MLSFHPVPALQKIALVYKKKGEVRVAKCGEPNIRERRRQYSILNAKQLSYDQNDRLQTHCYELRHETEMKMEGNIQGHSCTQANHVQDQL